MLPIVLVKNVMLPIELVPVRTVFVALATELVALCLVLILSAINGSLGPPALLLPVVLVLQVIGLLGLAWIVAGLGVALPDLSYFIGLTLFLLMFVSPIAFQPEMVPASLNFVLYLNPVFYMLEVFRDCIIAGRTPDPRIWVVYTMLCAGLFVIGGGFFRTFKGVLIDYE